MTDPARAQLETTQAELRELEARIAAWPERDPRLVEATARLATLTTQREDAERLERELTVRLSEERWSLDAGKQGLRAKWWMSALAWPAVAAGVYGAIRFAYWTLDHYSWPHLCELHALNLLLAPAVVNGLRLLMQGVMRLVRPRTKPGDRVVTPPR